MLTRLVFAIVVVLALVTLMRRLRARADSARGPVRGQSGMSRDEALQVLGLRPEASQKEVRQAHRRLLQKLHPDHGGSDYLAQRINEARDRLSRE